MEKQIYIPDLFRNRRTINRIGTISVFACRSRRTGQSGIRDYFSFGSHKIRPVLDAVQFIDRNFIKVYHVSDNMIGALFFFKKKTTARYTVLQRNRSYSHRTVVINDNRFLRFKFMEEYFIGQRLAEESKQWSKQFFQPFRGVNMQISRSAQQAECRD